MTSTTTAIIPTAPASADRVAVVVSWILAGASEFEIGQAIQTTWPSARTRPLIAAAMKEIVKNADADPSIARAWVIEATKLVYQRALEAGDFAAALRALKTISDMTGGE